MFRLRVHWVWSSTQLPLARCDSTTVHLTATLSNHAFPAGWTACCRRGEKSDLEAGVRLTTFYLPQQGAGLRTMMLLYVTITLLNSLIPSS